MRISTTKVIPLALVAAVSGAIAVQAAAAPSKTINVNDDFFKPQTVTVKKGTTLKFKFSGFHNVEADGKSAFKNIPDRSSGTVARKANKKGNFKLLCSIHDGMSLKLKVK